MNVAGILGDKGADVLTLNKDATMREAASLLSDKHVGSVVILDDGEKIAGILSERDIVTSLARQDNNCLDLPVSECMTSDVATCTKSDTVEYLMGQMTKHRFRHMPVVENGEMIGIVSIGDVVKQRIAETELEASAMRAYIATG